MSRITENRFSHHDMPEQYLVDTFFSANTYKISFATKNPLQTIDILQDALKGPCMSRAKEAARIALTPQFVMALAGGGLDKARNARIEHLVDTAKEAHRQHLQPAA